jgi:hypothetical protein
MPTGIYLQDKPLLRDIHHVMKSRGDNNLTKTARELLLEKIQEIRLKGDPRAEKAMAGTD